MPHVSRRGLRLLLCLAAITAAASTGWKEWRNHEARTLVTKGARLLRSERTNLGEPDGTQAARALALLQEAAELRSPTPHAERMTMWARALGAYAQQDPRQLETVLAEHRERYGWTRGTRWLAGRRARDIGDLREARRHAVMGLSKAPSDSHLVLLATDVALDMNEPEKAEGYLFRLPIGQLASSAAQLRAGLIYERKGKFAQAVRAYRRAGRQDPSNAAAWTNLGAVLRRAGKPERGTRAFSLALGADPHHAEALLGRGLCQLELGHLGKAAKDLQRARQLNPRNGRTEIAWGDLRTRQGRLDSAIGAYREGLRRGADASTAQVKLGNALIRAGRPHEAAGAFKKALSADPSLAAAHNGFGVSQMLLGRKGAARLAFQTAADIDPADPNPRRNMRLLAQAG